MNIVIVPTKRCNLRCIHCFRSTYESDFLDLELYKKFIDSVLVEKQIEFAFTGGEAAFHPQFDEMLSYLKGRAKARVVTNGVILSEAILNNKDSISDVCISFDGITPEHHDRLRGAGNFAKTLKTTSLYRKEGFSLKAAVTISRENAYSFLNTQNPFYRNLVSFCRVFGFKKLALIGMLSTDKNTVDGIDYSYIVRSILSQKIGSELRVNFSHLISPTECTRCPTLDNTLEGLVLLPDGKISLCCDLYDYDYPNTLSKSNQTLDNILGTFTGSNLNEILKAKDSHRIEIFRCIENTPKDFIGRGICDICRYHHH